MNPSPAAMSLYVHWPFCVSKCPYCDFNSHVRESVDQAAWRSALLADLAYEAAMLPGRRLESIFFGGGTPSLMPPATVAAIIDAASAHWTVAPDIEITLEANPSSVEAARFADLALAGVNRVSLGLQALEDEALHFLGRAHTVAEGLAALETAQAAFSRVSFDLIYALPGQTADQWAKDLERAIGFGTGHVSLYQLTIEPGTRFETLVRTGAFTPLDPDAAASLYELTQTVTDAAGISSYEISNHARAGQQSRHNLTYWTYGDYAGIGPGAHGRRTGAATIRHRKPENWMAAVAEAGHGVAQSEAIPAPDRAREALLMGLRLRAGVDLQELADRVGVPDQPIVDDRAIERLMGHGLVVRSGNHLCVTAAGMLVLDSILAEIVA